MPFIVATERGFFQKENLAVRMITFRGINVLMAALSRNGLDPVKDVVIVPIGGGTPERSAALVSGSTDATMVTSPTEYVAEKQGRRTPATPRDLANVARSQNTGIGAPQKKIDKDGDEIVRLLRTLRSASSFLQEQRSYAVTLFEKTLRFDRTSAEKFYSLLRDQYNPELTLTDGAIEDLLAVGTFRSKEKEKCRSICKPCAIGVLLKGRGAKSAFFVPAVPVVPHERTKLSGTLNGDVRV